MDEPLALITPTAKYYYHANHLYSVAALTNQAGAVVERYRYSSYGERTVLAPDGVTTRAASSYNQQVGFTGRYLDKETGLWYFRARYYSGNLGRFVSRDPIVDIDFQEGVAAKAALERNDSISYVAKSPFGNTKSERSQAFLYVYVENNPSNYTDPDGFMPYCKIKSDSFSIIDVGDDSSKSGKGRLKHAFDMVVEFEDCCYCCHYRQEVKGFMKYAKNWWNSWQYVKHELLPGTFLEVNTLLEDGLPSGEAYGHRDQSGWIPGNYYDLPVNQKTGCAYTGKDKPGFDDLTGYKYAKMKLNFEAYVKDSCQNRKTGLKMWTVEGSFERNDHAWTTLGGH